MKREVSAAVYYLLRMVVARSNLDKAKAEMFAEKLEKLLYDRCSGHWYPDCPSRGQAYRCIQISNGVVCDDPLIKACKESEITPSELCLPPEITLWIDPLEVSARYKEHCRPFTIARFDEEPSSVDAVTPDHTSDYHSATSSSCSSTSSSDNEEEAVDESIARAEADGYTILMAPRTRKRYGPARVKYVRTTLSPNVQYYYSPAPACPTYKKTTPVLLTMCPPPPQQVFGYYIAQPRFIVPQASLHPWRPVLH